MYILTLYICTGYGHINPVTPAGKLTCIVYAILGIPFTLMFLSALVQRLLSPTYRNHIQNIYFYQIKFYVPESISTDCSSDGEDVG